MSLKTDYKSPRLIFLPIAIYFTYKPTQNLIEKRLIISYNEF